MQVPVGPIWFGIRPLALMVTLALGSAAGFLAQAAHLPLALLLGALGITALVALKGWRVLGQPVHLPGNLRSAFVPVIGVANGGAFTPDIAAQMPGWLPSLLALLIFLPLVHGIGFLIYRAGGLSKEAAFFGATPGGLIEAVEMGRQAGADEALLTTLQFLRLIATIVAVPLIFLALTGKVVGSASGVQMTGAGHLLSLSDIAILALAGGLGFWGAQKLHFPAAQITGPVLLSALAHGLGLVEGVPPYWLIAATQIVLGCGLGARFVGANPTLLRRAAGLAVGNTLVALALAAGFALALHALVGVPVTGVFLAFAPGGLAEMSLIALSLQASVAYVTVHHVARIILAVLLAKLGAAFLTAGSDGPKREM